LDVRKVGTVNGQVALKLTEFGLVQIMGYAKKETFADYQPLFQEIAQRVTFDDSVRYRPRLTDAFPMVGGINTGELLAGAIGAIIIGGIIGLIAMVAKKSRRKNA
jgi:hypothetical protein